MPRDRLSHIYYAIHVRMFPQAATRDCKQYLQQLMIPESVMRVYRKGGGAVLQVAKARYMMSVMTENNSVPVSRQCFSCTYVSNIDFHK